MASAAPPSLCRAAFDDDAIIILGQKCHVPGRRRFSMPVRLITPGAYDDKPLFPSEMMMMRNFRPRRPPADGHEMPES